MRPFLSSSVQLAIFGAGSHAHEIAWIARLCGFSATEIVFIVDDNLFQGSCVGSINTLPFSAISSCIKDLRFIIGVGEPLARRNIAQRLASMNGSFATLVAPSALIGSEIKLGAGVVCFPNVIISIGTTIGNHVHLNTGASVSHDCCIDDFCSISPSVTICGHVQVGTCSFIGAGSTIINGTREKNLIIGNHSIIGAGSCVISSLPSDAKVVGVPARPLGTSKKA